MAKYRFSAPPVSPKFLNTDLRQSLVNACSSATTQESSSSDLDLFKATYVAERRLLDRVRLDANYVYVPAPSLNGGKLTYSIEETPKIDQWNKQYYKIKKVFPSESPVRYLRILFCVLRGSSLPTPTVAQLASEAQLELVRDSIKNIYNQLVAQFLSETERFKISARLAQASSRGSLAYSVHSALLTDPTQYSWMFRHCVAATTAKALSAKNESCEYCSKLSSFAEQYKNLALHDYTVFPREYDAAWGQAIPASLREAAGQYSLTM